jgi:transcriptional regulator with XRE-family HTH domain
MSKISELIGQRIRQYRAAKGINQEEMAHRSNMHTSHLGQIERGEKSATLDSLEKIVDALDITFEELFSFDRIPPNIDAPLIEKIVSYLRIMTPDEQNDVLRVVKILIRWKNASE